VIPERVILSLMATLLAAAAIAADIAYFHASPSIMVIVAMLLGAALRTHPAKAAYRD
jgi:hypothetical protein